MDIKMIKKVSFGAVRKMKAWGKTFLDIKIGGVTR